MFVSLESSLVSGIAEFIVGQEMDNILGPTDFRHVDCGLVYHVKLSIIDCFFRLTAFRPVRSFNVVIRLIAYCLDLYFSLLPRSFIFQPTEPSSIYRDSSLFFSVPFLL